MQNDKRTRRGAGAHSCVCVFYYTQGQILGAFILQKSENQGGFCDLFFCASMGAKVVRKGGTAEKVHQGDAGGGCEGVF